VPALCSVNKVRLLQIKVSRLGRRVHNRYFNFTGATLPSFQSGNDSVTLALPLPAPSGTRTGP